MLVRLQDGRGNLIGAVEISVQSFEDRTARHSATLHWVQRIWHTRGTFSDVKKSITLAVAWVAPWGWTVCAHWKERERLKRAKLIYPFSNRVEPEYQKGLSA